VFTVPDKFSFTPGGGSEVTIDATSKTYHLLLATGPQSSKLSYHESRLPSGAPADLTSATLLKGADRDYLIQIHGLLMVIAWLACSATGMVVARYYKETWRHVKPCGKDFWFRLHQTAMSSTVVLTLAAFIVIVTKVGFFPYDAQFYSEHSAHPVIGALCVVCAFVQPMMAFFRPHPGTDKRWLFDWSHWLVGNLAFILAVCAVFQAVELKAAALPGAVTTAMIAYVVIHAVFHLVLTAQKVSAARSLKNVHDVAASHGHSPDRDMVGSTFRKVTLALYTVFVWAVAISLIAFIFTKNDS